MSEPTLESLARQAAAGDRTASDAFFCRLDALLRSLDGEMLNRVARSALALKEQGAGGGRSSEPNGQAAPAKAEGASIPSGVVPLTPELLEWARQELNEEEVIATLRELRANGGLSSEELLSVLDDEEGRP